MHTINKLFLATLGLVASYTAQAQVGIGTIAPRTMLDVNGSLSVAETTATVTSNAATIPLTYSLVRLTGSATAAVALAAASSPAPVVGQHLTIYNGLAGYSATFAGQTIAAGQAVALLYSDGAWRPVVASAVAAAGANWGLTGNAGTMAGTSFLGTTDDADLVLKRNNVLAAQLRNGNTSFGLAALLYSSDSLSTAFGYKAGQGDGVGTTAGSANQFIGHQSGYKSRLGTQNQFSGYQSGYNNTGSKNQFSGFQSGYSNTTSSNGLFVGSSSGYNNTTGSNNQFIGFQSGYNNTTGHSNLYAGNGSGYKGQTNSYNTIVGDSAGVNNTASFNQFSGYQSGYLNTGGNKNQFSGYRSGYRNTTGSANQFSGFQSGYSNTTGHSNLYLGNSSGYKGQTNSYNTIVGDSAGINNTANFNLFIGYRSGTNNSTGSKNQFIGYRSGISNSTGSNNTLLGYNTNVATAALTNATAIGYLAQVSQNNSLVLGSISGTNGATANTFVGIGTTAPSYPLDVQIVGGSKAGGYGYLNSGGTVGTSSGSANQLSINSSGRIACPEFNAYSDARLKTVLGLSDSRTDLALVKQLQVTNYQMKDRVQYGDRAFKKVIAQQVESVFPQAINKNTGFIPSIYAAGTLRTGAPGQTLVTVPAAHHLHVGDKVRLLGEANGKVETTVLALGGDHTFAVALAQPETKVFVFGPEVADLRTVDYEALAMLNVSATQELARQVEALQAANAGLRASLADKASASTLTELQAALQTLRAEVQTLRAAGTTASLK